MRNAAWDIWVERARTVRIEDEIARRGIRLKGSKPDRCGPCPRCGGHDRFSINIKKQVFHCRQCKPEALTGDVIGFVQWIDNCGFKAAIQTLTGDEPCQSPAPKIVVDEDHNREQHDKAAWLWSQRQPIAGTIAERYLREARGITCPPPGTLGFLPARGAYSPALIAAYSIPGESKPGVLDAPTGVDSVHITRLLPDGSDRERGERAKITIGQPLGRRGRARRGVLSASGPLASADETAIVPIRSSCLSSPAVIYHWGGEGRRFRPRRR
jgi:CHC2 zinc finger